ncbi:MAG: carbohydrate ABC transporter permease [Lachnospiraceae bacterium]
MQTKRIQRKKKKLTASERVIYGILLILALIVLFPVIYIISLSFSDTGAVSRGEVVLLPVGFNLDAYKYVLQDARFGRSYINSIIYAAGSALVSVICTGMIAYPLSVETFSLRKVFTVLLMITMYFGGGMIPTYMVIRNLHLLNNPLVMIIPGAVSAYNVIIYRTFFQGIPGALREAAYIDGASQFRIFWKIILPLSKPLVATMSLFAIVGSWNNYFDALIYLNDNVNLQPLALYLRQLVVTMDMSSQGMKDLVAHMSVNPRTIRAATMLVAMLPIMCIYPFLQKYFASGIMIGSVKG